MTSTPVRATSSIDTSPKIRYAVVGLGWYSQSAALPAFVHAENSELVALVSDDPTKLTELSHKYGIEHTYNYDRYDELLMSGSINHRIAIEGDIQAQSFAGNDQVAAEFVYFSDCILRDKQPEPSGDEGLIEN
jgi:hypothetical protein